MTNNSSETNILNNPAVSTVPPVNIPPTVTIPPPKKKFPLIIVLIVLIISVAGLSYYFGVNGFKLSQGNKPDEIKTAEITPTTIPVIPPTRIEKNPASSPSGSPTNKVTEGLPVIPGSTVFTSELLGISFRHAATIEDTTPKTAVATLEAGNKVYVYIGNTKPESGQYVEVFTKDKSDSFEEAINKQFLKGISSADCFVKIVADKKLSANFTKAIITYPVPTDSDQPAFTYGDKCPSPYTSKGGIAYFLYDNNYPEKLLFFSIGQYAIDAQSGKSDTFWQETIRIIK